VQENHKNPFTGSDSSPIEAGPDFVVENHFTMFLLFACTNCARSWVEENLPPDHLAFGEGIVIEARYFWPILEGIQNDGLMAVPR